MKRGPLSLSIVKSQAREQDSLAQQNTQDRQMYNEIMKFCTIYNKACNLVENQNQCMAAEGMANIVRVILQDYYKVVAQLNTEVRIHLE
ncbi:unnamed protein product [Nezara viridula]|uniref:Uncharacterized protein n=1 Tax=Nezara viridula TaxID=85310 RepID=A0A9P0MRN0_NEZVI|nr:unnamed protein product [Nezara viridula]